MYPWLALVVSGVTPLDSLEDSCFMNSVMLSAAVVHDSAPKSAFKIPCLRIKRVKLIDSSSSSAGKPHSSQTTRRIHL